MNNFKAILFTVICTFLIQTSAKAENFSISSPDFKNGGALSKNNEFSGFGCAQSLLGPYDICVSDGNRFEGLNCNGKNIAPTIKWNDPPAKTKSFAITVYDPDMPTGGGWWHFISYNIPRDVREFNANIITKGAINITNDSGIKSYMGPCPPSGAIAHRYVYTVYALDSELNLPPISTAGIATYMINRHKIAAASMVATYARP